MMTATTTTTVTTDTGTTASVFLFVLQWGVSCGLPVILLILGLVVGRTIERRHLARLSEREQELASIPETNLRTVPAGIRAGGGALVTGSVVVASDYLKTFLAKGRNLIGGEVKGFDRLMERARREALCRLLDDARRQHAMLLVNVRFHTSNIGSSRKRKLNPMVEVIAYGTAVLPSVSHG